ncbi:hypothetical protein BC332_09533 [Capsicum chinense]|nr:hypothetical protein BC332_09533 [Capsicum chinense]
MKPLPSISFAYGLLLNDEKQRQVSTNSFISFSSGPASLNVGVVRNSTFPSKVNFDSFNSKISLICKYCKKPGHSIDKCYKLYNFSPDFKFTKSMGPKRTATNAEVALSVPADPVPGSSTPEFSGLSAEHSQLLFSCNKLIFHHLYLLHLHLL